MRVVLIGSNDMVPKKLSDKLYEFNGQRYSWNGRYFRRKGKYMHREVWKFFHGEIPPGKFHVHHIDGDPKNNAPTNLRLVSHKEHAALHEDDSRARKRQLQFQSIQHKGREAARKWHQSEEGRAWHREHFRSKLQGVHSVPVEKQCAVCDARYATQQNMVERSLYCSPACNQRALRARRKQSSLVRK